MIRATLVFSCALFLGAHCSGTESSCTAADVFCQPAAFFIWGKPLGPENVNLVEGGQINSGFITGTVPALSGGRGVEVSIDGGAYQPATFDADGTSWRFRWPSVRPGTSHAVFIRTSSVFWNESATVSATVRTGENRDLDGDGYADLVVGAELYDTNATNEGRVYIFYSPDSSFSSVTSAASADATISGVVSGENFGSRILFGDVNGDGYADIFVPARDRSVPVGSAGAVYIFHGGSTRFSGDRSVSTANTLIESQTTAFFGQARSISVGDLNGDGFADLAARIQGQNNLFLHYGTASGISSRNAQAADFLLDAENTGDTLAVASDIGYFNDDNFADLIVGAAGYASGANNGRAYVIHGRTDGLSGSALSLSAATFTGTLADEFGTAPEACDINNDGVTDFAVESSVSPQMYFFMGSSVASFDRLDSAADASGKPTSGTIIQCFDTDGDNVDEIVYFAPSFSSSLGRLYIYDGTPPATFTDAAATQILVGDTANGGFGNIAATADLNRDGIADLVVGAHRLDGGLGLFQGRIYIFYGRPGFAHVSGPADADVTITGEQGNSAFGIGL